MLDLRYRNETVVMTFRTTETDGSTFERLAAALIYAGQRPVVLTGVGTVFAEDVSDDLDTLLAAVRRHRAPVVAAINGDAIGTGYALAAAADLSIMSGGVVQPAGWAQPLGPGEAAAAGLVDLLCSPARLLDLAVRMARSGSSRLALAG